jgi:hypothetical protein
MGVLSLQLCWGAGPLAPCPPIYRVPQGHLGGGSYNVRYWMGSSISVCRHRSGVSVTCFTAPQLQMKCCSSSSCSHTCVSPPHTGRLMNTSCGNGAVSKYCAKLTIVSCLTSTGRHPAKPLCIHYFHYSHRPSSIWAWKAARPAHQGFQQERNIWVQLYLLPRTQQAAR